MSTPPEFAPDETVEGARRSLEAAGWVLLGTGDWSWVHVSPDGASVARVTPWDPAYLLHVQVCRRLRTNLYLQRIDGVSHLAHGGHVVFMERLYPADPVAAASLCLALDLPAWHQPKADWCETPGADPARFRGDPHLDAARAALVKAMEEGAASLPFWGGSDVSPRNVMADATGRLKVVDALGIRGPAIVAAIREEDLEALSALPAGALEAFVTIPPFHDGTEESRALQEQARRLAWMLRPG